MYQTTPSQRNSHAKSTVSLASNAQPDVPTRKWDDIISQPTLPNQGLKPQDTVTFRGGPSGRKFTNKELLAKADIILARSPNKNIPGVSHARPQLHLDSFKSPTRANIPVLPSYPATTQARENFHPFVTPQQSERMLRTLPTNFQSPPPGYLTRQETTSDLHAHVPSHFSSPGYDRERLDAVVSNIIQRSPGLMTAPFVHTIPGGRAPIQAVHQHPHPQHAIRNQHPHPEHVVHQHHHPEHVVHQHHHPEHVIHQHPHTYPHPEHVVPIPHYRMVHNVPQNVHIGSPDLAEIQRDFQQLRINSLKQPIEQNLRTPTPFISEYEEPYRRSAFAREILVDEIDESQIVNSQPDENSMNLQSDRDSCRCSHTSYFEPVPVREEPIREKPRGRRNNNNNNNNRYLNPVLDEPQDFFTTGLQTGGSGNQRGRSPVKNASNNNKQYHNPVLDEPKEVFRTGVQSGGSVSGKRRTPSSISNSRQNYEVPLEDSRAPEPQRFVEQPVQGRSERPKYNPTGYTPRISAAQEEPVRANVDVKKPPITPKESSRKRSFGMQTMSLEENPAKNSSRTRDSDLYEKERSDMFSKKSEGFLSPQKAEDSKDTQKRERDAKYSNKVESFPGGYEAPANPPKRKLPSYMSKTEKFFA